MKLITALWGGGGGSDPKLWRRLLKACFIYAMARVGPMGVYCDLSWLWPTQRQIDLHVRLSGGCLFSFLRDHGGYAAHGSGVACLC